MTEKRFTLCEVDLREYGVSLNEIMDNGVPISQEKVIDLLNKLNDENEQLKSSDNLADCECEIAKLRKENEQLKRQIHYLKVVCRNELDDETLKQVLGSLGDME